MESVERIRVGHALDLGAEGVMFPRLDTPEEVSEALTHLWHPPRGDRGVATYNRARHFGGDLRDAATVNDSLLGVVQIESLRSLQNVERIAVTPGVDAMFVGPEDLSTALGVAGQLDSTDFSAALAHVVEAAQRANVVAAILTGDPDRVDALNDEGFSFVASAPPTSHISPRRTPVHFRVHP